MSQNLQYRRQKLSETHKTFMTNTLKLLRTSANRMQTLYDIAVTSTNHE